jgi:type IV pilus assembly protein PilB
MSKMTPPAPTPSPSNNPKHTPASAIPGIAANKPGTTTPMAPSIGSSGPPSARGVPADRAHSSSSTGLNKAAGGNGNGSSGGAPRPASASPAQGGSAGSAAARPPAAPPATPASAAPPSGVSGGAANPSGMPPIDQLQGRPLGRVLTKMGKVTREQVVEALNYQKAKGGAIGRILIDLGHVKESDVNVALAAQKGYELYNLEGINISPDAIAAVPPQLATTNKILPIKFDKASKKLTIVMASQENFQAIDTLQSMMGYKVTAKIGDLEQIERLIQKYYQSASEGIGEILGELAEDETLKDLKGRKGDSIDLTDLKDAADSNPVRKLINLVLLQAIKDKASDIHFEPFEDEFKMRYRIDGVLYEMMPPPAHIAPAISSRIKVMSNLDIAERRMPQDGRIELNVNNQPIDLRVSVLPTMFGESVVMRVLDRGNVNLDLDKLGLRDDDLVQIRSLIRRPNGVCIVTGPTGSGKTTTLYSALRELNDISSKLITAEDPVEYDIDGIIQCQIKPDIELTFARILRAMLRQDPDVILVGEIRDQETAKIAVEASLTGHLVFSTLHTNDAPSSIARLLDLGLEPFLVTASIEGVIAQRLVRRICNNCKTEYKPTEEQLMELDLRPEDVTGRVFYYGKGCEACNNTGYRGRQGLYEIMLLDDEMRDMIIQHASTQVLRHEAKKRGMRTLRSCGLMAIYDGVTTIEEVVRETIVEE